jgi:hypothetical protein
MTGPNEPEPELGEIEWLDGDPRDADDPDRPGHRPPRIPHAAWYALVVVVLAAVVIAVTVSRHHSKRPAASTPTPSPTSTAPSPTPTPPTLHPNPPPRTPPVTVLNVGHPLLDVPRGIDLFARSGTTMLRLELATGRITRTSGVEFTSTAPTSMVPTRHGVLLMSYDPGSGLSVPDGQRPRPLPDRLTQDGGTVEPGPDLDHVWLMTSAGDSPRTQLVGLDGRPTGPTLPGGGESDGTGNLVVRLTGGVYLARPGSLQRITTGALVAVGSTRWLTTECDDQHRCTLDVVDRATGEHRVLGPTGDRLSDPLGQISPDGSIAAVARTSNSSDGSTELHLINLVTGADRTVVRLGNSPDTGLAPLLWTPDSRWLLTIGVGGRIVAVDRSGHVRTLTRPNTTVTQLALRAQ